ncbi:hypothetical protein [Microcoleus asticus]|uniref:hypothetical protein n=1 Tax=Microcoleus asticus TaxID=2815231 RepID=UPI001C12F2F7|nr:hypothetical protein [Microcoleus asticus]
MLEANTQNVMKVMQEIPENELFLIKSLTKLARQFQFEQILDLIEPLMVHNRDLTVFVKQVYT